MKYRIVEVTESSGEKYWKLQYRFLWFFWNNVIWHEDYDGKFFYKYNSLENARKAKAFKEQEELKGVKGKETKRVVE